MSRSGWKLHRFALLPCVVGMVAGGFAQGPTQPQVSGSNLKLKRTDYQTDIAPYSITVGDVNGDGKPDLLTPNTSIDNNHGKTISILLGNGNGTFQKHMDIPGGDDPEQIAVGDFNGDHKLDMAVVNSSLTSYLSIFLGNGDGSFQPPVDYPMEAWGSGVVVGDFNHDGKLDVLAASFGSSTLQTYLGKGDGSFQQLPDIAVSHSPGALTVGDFNHDGKLDLAIADYDNLVSVFLGKGDGTFQDPKFYRAGNQPSDLKVGDFNGDGKLDLAVLNVCNDQDPECIHPELPGTVSILLGKGDGTFKAKKDYLAGLDPLSIAVGDFNGDGKLDAAVANGFDNTASILFGNGDGTLSAAQFYSAGSQPAGIAVGHFGGSGQGSADLAISNLDSYNGHSVTVLLNEAATRMRLASSANPSHQGEAVTFTATVRALVKGAGQPKGTVTFLNGSVTLGRGTLSNGVATFTTSDLPLGNNMIVAKYGGNPSFNPNSSPVLVEVVKP